MKVCFHELFSLFSLQVRSNNTACAKWIETMLTSSAWRLCFCQTHQHLNNNSKSIKSIKIAKHDRTRHIIDGSTLPDNFTTYFLSGTIFATSKNSFLERSIAQYYWRTNYLQQHLKYIYTVLHHTNFINFHKNWSLNNKDCPFSKYNQWQSFQNYWNLLQDNNKLLHYNIYT